MPFGGLIPYNIGRLTASPAESAEPSLDDLLASLELDQPQTPPRPGTAQTVLGLIGDSLMAQSRVMAGGLPPEIGVFAGGQLGRQREFEVQSADAVAAGRDLRNRIRVGDFQRKQDEAAEVRKEGRIRSANQDIAEAEAATEQAKQNAMLENKVRSALIDELLSRGVDTKGVDLLTAPTAALQELLGSVDPTASFKTIMKTLPPDMQMGNIHIDKDGKLSFDIERKGSKQKNDEIPAGVITALINAGEDPAPFISDPTLAGAARAAATANKNAILVSESDRFLDDIQQAALKNQTKANGDPDPVNIATASAASDIRIMGQSMAKPEEVSTYYTHQADIAADMVNTGELDEQQATDYLTRVRQMLKVRFPQMEFAAPSGPLKAPPPPPEGPVQGPREEPGAVEKMIGGVGKGLSRAATGIRQALEPGPSR